MHDCRVINFVSRATLSWPLDMIWFQIGSGHQQQPCLLDYAYSKISNIRRTKSPNLNASSLGLQLSVHNILKPGVKWRMKMWLEQRRQAVLQLHLSDQQFNCLLKCVLYWRLDGGHIAWHIYHGIKQTVRKRSRSTNRWLDWLPTPTPPPCIGRWLSGTNLQSICWFLCCWRFAFLQR